jgi:hypothetical protein
VVAVAVVVVAVAAAAAAAAALGTYCEKRIDRNSGNGLDQVRLAGVRLNYPL